MSSDLLKEFGSLQVNPWHTGASQNSANRVLVDEEDFGDFEIPGNDIVTHTQSSLSLPNAVRYTVASEGSGVQKSSTSAGSLQPYIHSSTTDVQASLSNDDDWRDFSQQSVIFDADVESTRQKKEAERTLADHVRSKEPISVLPHPTASVKEYIPTSPIPAITKTNGSQGPLRHTNARLQSSKDPSKRRGEATKATDSENPTMDEEPWVDFEAAEAAKPGPESSKAPVLWTVEKANVPNLGPPPSNIPPPSVLLPVIAKIFGSLATELKTLTSHPPLDQPITLSQIRALLSVVRAAARVLAGRKLRWKRDSLLAQSMKIGPAHSGKVGGMKLAGLDKAESRREDQEAAEALQVWKQQVGPLRSMIAALNSQLAEHERFKIPEIADNMPIRQGKPSEGMVSAPKCCFLCGIKRDERVAKADVDVEDSFREWWVEHWGHVDCVDFWENHKDSLRQR